MIEVPLSRGLVALIDDADGPLVLAYRWHVTVSGGHHEAVSYAGGRKIKMHRLIMDAQPGETVDHISRESLDNQRENLRKCTQRQNSANSDGEKRRLTRKSLYKGVYLDKGRWRAGIQVKGKTRYLGYYPTEEGAAHAYNTAALEAFGEFARVNILPAEVAAL